MMNCKKQQHRQTEFKKSEESLPSENSIAVRFFIITYSSYMMLNNTVYYIDQSPCNVIVSVNKRICIVEPNTNVLFRVNR